MTPDEAITKAFHFLTAQGKPSRHPSGFGCAYRGVGGEACTIGLFMDEEAARKADAFGDVRELMTYAPDLLPDWARADPPLADAMQAAHDKANPGPEWVADMQRRMRAVAADFKLTIGEATP